MTMWLRRVRRSLRGLGAAAALLGAAVCPAQSPAPGGEPGSLNLWIVRPVTAVDRAVQRAGNDARDISVYREMTAGDFGRPSSEVGQTAGSYGKPASEVGQNAGSVGVTAGSYGQTAGSLPGNVKSQTAGSYGQTAGSFGTPASEFNGAPPRTGSAAENTFSRDSKGSEWTTFLENLHGTLPRLEVRFLEVNGLELRARLAAAAGAGGFPDILVADRMPDWWASGSRGLAVLRLAQESRSAVFPGEREPPPGAQAEPYAQAWAMVAAPHPEAAREFLEWWYTGRPFFGIAGRARADLSPPEAVAQRAVTALLNGGTVEGFADPAMARLQPVAVRAEALGVSVEEVPPDLSAQAAVVTSQANRHLAVVRMHAVCVSRKAYGELFPVVILRPDERGQWKVLQLSLGMELRDAGEAYRLLQPYSAGAAAPVSVATPALAFPGNADRRTVGSGLRLAWDEAGDDGLLVVEWQRGPLGRASASSIFLVSDADGRERTEVEAPFADAIGPMRWRVWAVGRGGVVRISDWRAVEMLP